MSQEMTCIVCPMGCRLSVDRQAGGELAVTGNRCPRGAAYAKEELLAPKRTVTATCALAAASGCAASGAASAERPRRLPCRSAAAFPRERVPELLAAIYALEARPPVERGQVLIPNALGTGIDVIATRTIR